MNYLVIDLEMCKVPKNYRREYKYANEIIEIGAVLLDENYETVGEFKQYVHPKYGVLDNFITSLTGIKNSNLKNAATLREALENLIAYIGEKEIQVMAWSDTDYDQLLKEVGAKKILEGSIKHFLLETEWTDYQKTFGNRYGFDKAVGLDEALFLANIKPEGRAHDGLVDAENTARLVKKLELNPEYQIKRMREDALDHEDIGTSLGDLFAKLGISA